MRGKLVLYIDQYGRKFLAKTVQDLRKQVGGGRISKMYVDGAAGGVFHVGYVIGQYWCTAYTPVRIKQ